MQKQSTITLNYPPDALIQPGDVVKISIQEDRWWIFLMCWIIRKPVAFKQISLVVVGREDACTITVIQKRWWSWITLKICDKIK